MKKSKSETTNYAAQKMAELRLKAVKDDERREQERIQSYRLYIDNDNYSQTLGFYGGN